MPNRLINESSPYLQQHAHNPVDWYPWGEEALDRARGEDRPILLSIGYSACHWCHVMERESFENEETARLMNENFVSIKVDREERPDLDSIYMSAVQALTGRGGWPMTVFLTPEGKPYYGGTYFPPEDRHGIPGFPRVLQAMAEAYKSRRGEVTAASENLMQRVKEMSSIQKSHDPLTTDVLHRSYGVMVPQFDDRYGGFGQEPKFPQPMIYEFLLRYHHRTGDTHALHMVEVTLEKMALGGIYDQIGGGFHRYSTDAHWLVPHFEKMLYDNALLSRLYLHAYQVTGKPLYRRIVEETLDYVLREMTHPDGGFYSAQDADSEGVEGKYFVWRPREMFDVLGQKEGELVCRYFGITEEGNFEGTNILHVVQDEAAVAKENGMDIDALNSLIRRAKARLLEHRQGRVPPVRDDKVLTAWNGLMLNGFAKAASVFGRQEYLEAAENNAWFLLDSLRQDGRLLRTYRHGYAKLKGYLEDYAFLVDGLLTLHEATLNPRWLEEAITLGQSMVDLFWDEGEESFYDTGRDHEGLVVRPRDVFDNAIPSGGSAATDVMLRLTMLTGDDSYTRKAVSSLRLMKELMARAPTGLPHWLCALDFYLSTPKEIAIIGDRKDEATQALLRAVHKGFLPNRVLVGQEPGEKTAVTDTPLLQDRGIINGSPTAYVCENYACQMPVNTPEELANQLSS